MDLKPICKPQNTYIVFFINISISMAYNPAIEKKLYVAKLNLYPYLQVVWPPYFCTENFSRHVSSKKLETNV